MRKPILIAFALIVSAISVSGQIDDICAESGNTPSLDSPFANIPYIYGKVTIKGFENPAKQPKVFVTLVDPQRSQKRLMIDKSGNYCFRRTSGSNGNIVVEVDSVEVARRSYSSFGAAQQREDFDIFPTQPNNPASPGVVSAKFARSPNEKTADLYAKASEAEIDKDFDKTVAYLKDIVRVDPTDYVAWAKLGSVYLERNSISDAEPALRHAIELNLEYTTAWINFGKLRIAQKQFEAAAEIFKHVAELDPTSARTFQLLGEVYLQSRQGTLGVQALNEAIRLDPKGMAECHLQLSHLYQLAGANKLAANEYKLFLAKVLDHPDRKKFEKFIKDNQ